LFLLAGLALLSPATMLVAQWTGQLVGGAIGAVAIWRAARALYASAKELRAILPTALMLHATTVSALLLDSATILLINRYLAKEAVGLYQLAQQMIAVMLIIPQAVSVVLTAQISRSTPAEFWPRHRDVLIETSLLMVALSAVAYFLAPLGVRVLAGPQFETSVELFRLLLPSIAGLTLAQLLTPQWISRGLFGVNATLTIGTAALMLVGTAYAIGSWGITGAAYARSIAFGGVVLTAQLGFVAWLQHDWRKKQKIDRVRASMTEL
jgi:O-antigen/teichoic acid export membrane protein